MRIRLLYIASCASLALSIGSLAAAAVPERLTSISGGTQSGAGLFSNGPGDRALLLDWSSYSPDFGTVWITDGTPGGTQSLLSPSETNFIRASDFQAEFGNRTIFGAGRPDALDRPPLYVTDGTSAGTYPLTAEDGTPLRHLAAATDASANTLWLVDCPHSPECGIWSMQTNETKPVRRASFTGETDPSNRMVVLQKSVYFLLDHALWSYRIGGPEVVRVGPAEDGLYAFNGNILYTCGSLYSAQGRQLCVVADGSELPVQLTPAAGTVSTSSPVFVKGATAFFLMGDRNVIAVPESPEQLWSTDGTPAGTRAEMAPLDFTYEWQDTSWLGVVGRRALFIGPGGGLWVTEGNGRSSTLFPVCRTCHVTSLQPAEHGLTFGVWGGTTYEFWRTDGTKAGTKKLLNCTSECRSFVTPAGTFLQSGSTLLKTDGTPEGTSPWMTQMPPSDFSHPWRIFRGNTFYYHGKPSQTSQPVIRVDLATRRVRKAVRIPLVREGMNPSPGCIHDFGDRIAYVAGAVQLNTVAKTGGKVTVVDNFASCPVAAGGKLFYARSPSLMVLDPAATGPISLGPLAESDYHPIVPWQAGIAFVRNDHELWTSDGTRAGTARRASFPAISYRLHLAAGPAAVFVTADGFDSSLGIWRTTFSGPPVQIAGPPPGQFGTFELDAPPARLGTSSFVPIHEAGFGVMRLVDGDLTPHPLEHSFLDFPAPRLLALPQHVIALGRETASTELFSLAQDGTVESLGAIEGYQDRWIARVGSRVCYPAAFRPEGPGNTPADELWCTDGTVDGTQMLKDIYPGTPGSAPSSFLASGGLLFFSARDPIHGRELWVTDGTAGGTRLFLDLQPGSQSSAPEPLAVIGGYLYFSAAQPSGRNLWRIALTP